MKKIIGLILGVICVSSFAFFYFSQKSDKISLEISQPEITKISLDEDNNSVLSNPDKVYIYNVPNDDIFLQSSQQSLGMFRCQNDAAFHLCLRQTG